MTDGHKPFWTRQFSWLLCVTRLERRTDIYFAGILVSISKWFCNYIDMVTLLLKMASKSLATKFSVGPRVSGAGRPVSPCVADGTSLVSRCYVARLGYDSRKRSITPRVLSGFPVQLSV
jgi:hypothetical protein